MSSELLQSMRVILKFPMWQKVLSLIFVIVGITGYFVETSYIPTMEEQQNVSDNIKRQNHSLSVNIRIAKNLPEKKKEYDKLEAELMDALDMLPKRSQIPELLKSVSGAARKSGLEIKAFNPTNEVEKDLYAEVPVSFSVEGDFGQLMQFIRLVGSLPRIVNIHNVSIHSVDGKLSVSGQAITYRFTKEKKKKGKKK